MTRFVWRRSTDSGWTIFSWFLLAILGGAMTGAFVAYMLYTYQ